MPYDGLGDCQHEDSDCLHGFWHSYPGLPAGLCDYYIFNCVTGTYEWHESTFAYTDRVRVEFGTYDFSDSCLTLRVMQRLVWEGGVIGNWDGENVLEDVVWTMLSFASPEAQVLSVGELNRHDEQLIGHLEPFKRAFDDTVFYKFSQLPIEFTIDLE